VFVGAFEADAAGEHRETHADQFAAVAYGAVDDNAGDADVLGVVGQDVTPESGVEIAFGVDDEDVTGSGAGHGVLDGEIVRRRGVDGERWSDQPGVWVERFDGRADGPDASEGFVDGGSAETTEFVERGVGIECAHSESFRCVDGGRVVTGR
jgi:hypothetical protein